MREIKDAERLLEEWEPSGRAIYRVDFEGTLVQGELWCDFDDLEPRKDHPVLLPRGKGDFTEATR